ncbi:MBL fold metallo-hydrolase [Roseobacter sp. N2S]|uniref:MBL fold metallo-hydrolase n=1 Tax=Roseobacter sp. N2S TaxID=2663844 RepID=UPI00285CE9EF|nr:MBL fold metallo-hydrolase [Roseobacter sp. N2S]MDR6263150.1 glyoxylase-like metal-dependent hydrolase (beta-lactamase superfamily II) [Roseobacter sp. N2S]
MSRINKTAIGDIEIIALTDGATQFGTELFPGTEETVIQDILAAAKTETIDTNFNAFIVKSGSDTMLVDAGPRDLFGPTCGFLKDAMEEVGIYADDITHLYFTHLHPDHVAGALTPDGQAVFAKAQMFISEADYSFWNTQTFTDDTLLQWQKIAKTTLAAYAGRTEQVKGGDTLIKEVTTLNLPGHTPGHMGFRVDSGADSFAHVGDIAHSQVLQFADPEIGIAFDIDMDMARTTRKRTLDMVTADKMTISGGHMLRPNIGRLERAGTGYIFKEDH